LPCLDRFDGCGLTDDGDDRSHMMVKA